GLTGLRREDARGRTVIITGSSRGIGKEAAIEFADRHARVIVTARTLEAAKQTVVDIRRKTFFGEVIPMKLDLGCIQSVKEFYHEIIKSYDTIDILINNAGVLVPSNEIERTADGFETHFGGCQTILYCALSKKCAYESGLMYRNCDLWTSDKYYFPDDILMPIPDKPVKLNDADASRLWDESEKCLQMKFPVV
ncbi:Retinol dehydrogenase 13, partial [Orchesella cincta]